MVTPSATTFSGNTGSTPCASKTFHPQRCVALSLPPNRARFNWIGFATYGQKVLASVAFAGFEPPINYRVNLPYGYRDGRLQPRRQCGPCDDSYPRPVDHLDFRHRMNLPCSVTRQILSPVVLIFGSALH